MTLLRKVSYSPAMRNQPLFIEKKPRLHFRIQYPRIILGMLCLILLLVIMLALPAGNAGQPPYLKYDNLPVQASNVPINQVTQGAANPINLDAPPLAPGGGN